MNSYEIQNDKIKSTLIKVEALQKEYEVTLQQYQEAGKNYITRLETDKTFVALKGRSWWGTKGLKEGSVVSKEECENMCAVSKECSGATFNPVKRYCWTRTGNSSITVGQDNDYALITQQKASLSTMKYLNEKLLNLNQQISDELKNIRPEVIEQYNEKNVKQKQLDESYQQLLEQKVEMDRQLREYNSIEEEEQNQGLYANQQNMTYRIWVLITCLVVLVTLKNIFGVDNPPISMTIWLLIIIVLIILTYSLNSRSGFIMWTIFLAFIVLTKSV